MTSLVAPALLPQNGIKDSFKIKGFQSNDYYRKLKELEREVELLTIQEEYIKDETKNLKRCTFFRAINSL